MKKKLSELNSKMYENIKIIDSSIDRLEKIRKEAEKINGSLFGDYGGRDALVVKIKKIGLLTNRSNLISVCQPSKLCPNSFLFEIKNKKYKISDFFVFGKTYDSYRTMIDENSDDFKIELFNLIISRNGDLSLVVMGDNKTCVFTKQDSLSLLLDIPILFAMLLEDGDFESRYPEFEKFIKANSSCTLGSVYNYVTKNLNDVLELPFNLKKFFKETSNYLSNRERFDQRKNSISKDFCFQTQENGNISYDFYKSENNYVFFMNTWATCEFPIKIVIEDGKITPYFLPKEYFSRGIFNPKTFKKEIESQLLTTEEEVKNKIQFMQNAVSDKKNNKKKAHTEIIKKKVFDILVPSDVKKLETAYSNMLIDNLLLTLSAFNKTHKENKIEKLAARVAEDNNKLKDFDKDIREAAIKSQSTLTKMYEKELLIANI